MTDLVCMSRYFIANSAATWRIEAEFQDASHQVAPGIVGPFVDLPCAAVIRTMGVQRKMYNFYLYFCLQNHGKQRFWGHKMSQLKGGCRIRYKISEYA